MNTPNRVCKGIVYLTIALLILLTGSESVQAQPQLDLFVTISPTSGPGGISVTLSGSGWTGNTSGHEIHWDSKTGPVLGTFSTNPNGVFSTSFKIPGSATPGTHTLWVCDRCKSIILLMPTLWTSVNFEVIAPTPTRVPPTPTPTDVPTECDALGIAGEVVIDFEGALPSVIERNSEIHPGITYKGDVRAQVIRPTVATKSYSHALVNSEMMEFGSINDPLRFGFDYLQDVVGVYVGLNNPRWAEGSLTATLTARGYPCEPDVDGHYACAPRIVGTDSVSFGPEATPVKECLLVEAQNIFEVLIDYGPAADPEIIDNLTLRGPEEPEPLPEDDNSPIVTIELPESGVVQPTNMVRLQGTVREDRELASMRYQVNSGPFHEMGFTSAGYTPEGERLYLFAIDPLPVEELRTCGDNLVQVIAVDASSNEGMGLTAFPVYYGDLAITSVEAVQVIYGAPLVQGKATAFRAKITSTFTCGIDVDVKLELPEGQWDTFPPSTGHYAVVVDPSWEYPETWGPYRIPAGVIDHVIMLPLIPVGEESAPFNASARPYGLISNVEVGGVYGPDVRVVPRPVADRVSFSVEVDPADSWPETDDGNNRVTSPAMEARPTRNWRFLFVPTKTFPPPLSYIVQPGDTLETIALSNGVTVDTIEDYNADYAEPIGGGISPGDRILVPRPACAPELGQMRNAARRQMEYLLATYPIADSKISWSFPALQTEACGGATCGYNTTWQQDENLAGEWEDGCSVYGRVAVQALEDHDFGIVQACSGGQSCGGYGILVGADGGEPLLAHEFNHSIVPMKDIYSLDCYVSWDERYCELPSGDRFYCCYDCYDDEKETREAQGKDPSMGCTVDCGASGADCESVTVGCPSATNCPACCWELCQSECDAVSGTVYGGPDGRTQVNMPAGEGFWVNRWLPISGRTYFMDGPSGNNWQILESAAAIGALEGRDPGCGMNGADLDGYILLAEKFHDPTDPAALLVSGLINRATGTIVLNPFITLPQSVLDIEPGGEGDYVFVLLGPSGEILNRSGFSPHFYRSDPAGGSTDEFHFAFRVEWVDSTTRIELRDGQGEVLAARSVTTNSPELRLTAPKGGEVWQQGASYTIRWEASDADGDELTYSLALSADAGETWISIGTNLDQTSFKIDTTALAEGSEYLVRVRATDGVNTAEDESDGVFSISAEAPPAGGNLILGALILLGLAGVGILVAALVMFVRRRSA